ncbi:hypothetical protein MP228_012136 [Amoeboaphelidium protococcarum]|nr:hypothetical protein MP228_012136 [Amoeboaphelidium protococcarum]
MDDFVALYSLDGTKHVASTRLKGTCVSVERYEKLNKIGEGTYGVVHRARDRETGRVVALKKIRFNQSEQNHNMNSNKNDNNKNNGDNKLPAEGLPVAHHREIQILKSIIHPNIVRVHCTAVSSGNLSQVYTVMEYCPHDLASLLDSDQVKGFTAAEIKSIMYQLIRGVEYLHRSFIIHRDLKLSNLLLTDDGVLKIADFGLARKFNSSGIIVDELDDERVSRLGHGQTAHKINMCGMHRPMTPKVVTLWYRSPELLLGAAEYSIAVDVWSVGCIFGELLGNTPLLPAKHEVEQLSLIRRILGPIDDSKWPNVKQLPLYEQMFKQVEQFENQSKSSGLRQSVSSAPNPSYEFLQKRLFPPEGHAQTGTVTLKALELLESMLRYNPEQRMEMKIAATHPYFSEHPKRLEKSVIRQFRDFRKFDQKDSDGGDQKNSKGISGSTSRASKTQKRDLTHSTDSSQTTHTSKKRK